MNLSPSGSPTVAANVSSKTTLNEPGHLAKLELSDGSSLYAKLVVIISSRKEKVSNFGKVASYFSTLYPSFLAGWRRWFQVTC